MAVLSVAGLILFGISRQAGHLLSRWYCTLNDQYVGSLKSYSVNEQVLWCGTYGLSSLSERSIFVVFKNMAIQVSSLALTRSLLSLYERCIIIFSDESIVLCIFSDVDECQSNPCVNGGNCTNKRGGFDCSCPSGFTGKTCGQGKQREEAIHNK